MSKQKDRQVALFPEPRRSLQSHGENSKVYVPILRYIFKEKYTEGNTQIEFTLDDIRRAALALGIQSRNPADVIYRMRSRTKLPPEMLALGFHVLKQIGRGRYRLEVAQSTVIECPDCDVQDALDLTPLPVRRLLPEEITEIDEQGLLVIVSYSKLLDNFTGLQVSRLRSHVRKSVAGVGQAELDEVDVAVALRDDELPVVFPIEAKAIDEPVNRVQVCTMVYYATEFYPGLEVRPIVLKLDHEGIIHVLEFLPTINTDELRIVKHASYRLNLSEAQRRLIRSTTIKAHR